MHILQASVPELDSSSSIMDWLGMFVKVSKGTCRIWDNREESVYQNHSVGTRALRL
jgi:hypothetical protein